LLSALSQATNSSFSERQQCRIESHSSNRRIKQHGYSKRESENMNQNHLAERNGSNGK
jgi:hypothetical protein